MRRFVTMLALTIGIFAAGCGESDEPTADGRGRTQDQGDSGKASEEESTKETQSQAVVELTISGMTNESDAEEVRKDLEWVSDVEEAKVDFASGVAKVLMESDVSASDVVDSIEDLRDAVDDRFTVTGFGWEMHESTTVKIGW